MDINKNRACKITNNTFGKCVYSNPSLIARCTFLKKNTAIGPTKSYMPKKDIKYKKVSQNDTLKW
jgi:hypothetical protein